MAAAAGGIESGIIVGTGLLRRLGMADKRVGVFNGCGWLRMKARSELGQAVKAGPLCGGLH